MRKNLVLVAVFLATPKNIYAKELRDKSLVRTEIEKTKKIHPRLALLRQVKKEQQKAMLLSMLFPCGGQLYNKNFWTAGAFYALYGIFGGVAWYWHNRYNKEGMMQLDNPEYNDRGASQGCERFRMMGIIGLAATYVLSVVEAYSSASMKTFDVSDDLSFVVEPKNKNGEEEFNLGLNF